MSIKVSNAIDSSYEKCDGGCVSWLLHWENCVDDDDEICSVVGCNESEGLVGAHVYDEDDDEDETCYIIPLCKRHNHHTYDILNVRDDTDFVEVDVLDTCTSDYEEYDEDSDDEEE